MFKMEAPWPALEILTIMPDPQFSDQEGRLGTVSRKLAMDGTRYTYVKRRDRRKLHWTFVLSRNKALEVREFFLAYFAEKVRITDHRDRVWLGYFTSNPFEFEGANRANPAIQAWPRGEVYTLDLEFEGEEV